MASERIVGVPNKTQLSNYGSKLVLVVQGPGLSNILYASGRLARGQKPHAKFALMLETGEIVQAKRVKCDWKPYAIEAVFEFPGGLTINQRCWVEWPFVHSTVSFKGSANGAKLIAEGVSYDKAKALVSDGVVMLEEIQTKFKPFVLQIASSVTPEKVLLSEDGATWKESDFTWSEDLVHYRMIFNSIPREMTVSAHLGKLSDFLPKQDWEKSRRRADAVKREWVKAYADEFPDIDCPDHRFRDVVQYCYYVHRGGVLTLDGMLPYPFVAPSKIVYPAWWMWDTAFQSIVDAWMKDPAVAYGDLLNHTILQTPKGCIQDAAGEFYANTGVMRWIHPEQYDNFPPASTGPCATGLALWDVYQKTGDTGILKRMFPHMVIYERWLLKSRPGGVDPDLIMYQYWADVGWDNSKRWGKTGLEKDAGPSIDWELPVLPVDGNVFLLMFREAMSKIAAVLGDKEREREFADKASRTRKAIDKWMWSEEKGFYFDILPDGRMLDVWSPAGFVPLLAGMPGKDTYHRLREHMLDTKKFWTKAPLPTLSIDDEDCDGIYWRGPTWPVVNWQVNEGLFDYDPELAMRLLTSTVGMMTQEGYPTCNEYYNALTGKASGATDQGWGAMPVDLILRRVFGLNPKPDCLELKPYLPADWPTASVRNVFVAGTSVSVRYARSASGLTATVRNTGRKAVVIKSGDKQLALQPAAEGVIQC